MTRALWWLAFNVYGRVVPWRAVPPVSRLLFSLLRPFRYRRRVALGNLQAALPERASEHGVIERRAFMNLLRVYLELPILANASRQRVESLLVIENGELLRRPATDRHGALLLSGHLGNWELLALGSAIHAGRPFLIPVRPQADHGFLKHLRERFGNRTTVTGDRGGFRALQQLAEGAPVAMLADQSPGREDPSVPFFNLDTRFHPGPARLALRSRPDVVLGFAHRRADGRYGVRLELLAYDDLMDDPDGHLEFTRRYAEKLEEAIRRDPESWVWHHRRWKHSPGVSYE